MAQKFHQERPPAGPVRAKNFTKTPKVVSKLVKPLKRLMRLMSGVMHFQRRDVRPHDQPEKRAFGSGDNWEKSKLIGWRPIGPAIANNGDAG
jgi:hypothetical protein